MTITFYIEYRTNWGEEVKITGSLPELGNFTEKEAYTLHTTDGIHWTGLLDISLPEGTPLDIKYNYQIHKEGKVTRKEWDIFTRTLQIDSPAQKVITIYDFWKNIPDQAHLYSSAFTDCLLSRNGTPIPLKIYSKNILIKAYCPRLSGNYALAVCGNQPALGNWNPDKALLMSDKFLPEWQIVLDASSLQFPLEYKFILYNLKENRAEGWESNPNRYLPSPVLNEQETLVISDRYVYFDLPLWKGAGTVIPVFSLKSENSFGIGDFSDLKKMIDWCVKTRQQVLQILPVNDTASNHTWTDSYPYKGISVYALHPIYLSLEQLGKLEDQERAAYFRARQKVLNAYPAVNYEETERLKWEYFRLIFRQDGPRTLESKNFLAFFKENEAWLRPYAAFSYLRDLYKTPDFRQWPRHAVYNARQIKELCRPGTKNYNEIAIYYYLQYHLHLQLRQASIYARQQGIVLKGDIPIGINRNSVEAWTEPHYFNLDGQAGAPPDDFSVNGQNWGFPTYNWEEMEKDGYRWWTKRLRKMAEYFDAYRIDHILGFFRIWEIPLHAVHGLLGQFSPSLPLSREEIESYGIPFREDLFLKPYIDEYFLQEKFGSQTQWVKQTFLQQGTKEGIYDMRPGFDTQRKVEVYFKDKNDADSIRIREALYTLISNVLFLRDHKNSSAYHPRISIQSSRIYQILGKQEQSALDRLYNHYYYERHNEFWYREAMKKLPCLTSSTRMLVCGEDLGMIPACVENVMNDLQILSLEIQRMPKNPLYEFGNVNEYPYRSVCSVSTHDMSTLREWWEEDTPQTQRYYNQVLHHYGTAPAHASGLLCEQIIRQHLYGNSMLCILSFQDWLSLDEAWRSPNKESERINIPSDPHHYWRYRMHLTLEELSEAESLNHKIKELILQTGRHLQK